MGAAMAAIPRYRGNDLIRECDLRFRKESPALWDDRAITVGDLSSDGETDLLLERLRIVYGWREPQC